MMEPSSPALIAIWRAGQESALRTISTPVFWSSLRSEAERVLILFQDLADDDGAVLACVNRDLASRPGECLAHDIDASLLVVVKIGSRTRIDPFPGSCRR